MTLAEKLAEVGNNRPKLYNKGALDYSPQETVSGEAIGITDISPVEHNMGVSVRSKNLIPPQNSLVTVQGYTYDSTNRDGSFIINTVGDGSISSSKEVIGKNLHDLLIDGETYTFAMDNFDEKPVYLVLSTTRLSDNIVGYHTASPGNNYTQRFTVDKSAYRYDRLYLQINPTSEVFENVVVKPILAIGSYTSLPFAPYIEDISTVKLFKSGEGVEPVMYDVQADGTVEGVKSLYPNTTLYTDTSGAVIDCTYYQDGRKVKENLTDMILSLGGVINE